MSLHDHAPSHAHAEAHGGGHETHHPNYVKIYLILLALLVVSILGPELEIRAVTLITAFGVACVKAWMVAKNFMHINVAPRYVAYLVATTLVFMLLFVAGTAPDVMKFSGTRWEKIPVAHVQAAPHGEHGDAAHH
jgi:caa(3)-type oxidase subunit IV